jgi:hypothetical protein
MKYEVNLNWHGEQVKLFTHAGSEKQALSNCIIRLAMDLGVYKSKVRSYFNNGKDCYKVKEI